MKKKLLSVLLTLTLVLSLVACGSKSKDDKVITIGVTPVPHKQITEVVVPLLEAKGYTVKIVEFNDYVQPNTSLEDGELDANYFQTLPYLEEQNESRDLHLVSVKQIHLEPMGLYSNTYKSLAELPDGASIALPNDESNESRAIKVLATAGLITLGSEGLVHLTDITENPHNYEFVEVEAATLPRTLADVDAAVINGNYAMEAGFTPATDALTIEDKDSKLAEPYGNAIVVKEGNEETDKTKALIEAFTSEEVRTFINDTYEGSVIPVF